MKYHHEKIQLVPCNNSASLLRITRRWPPSALVWSWYGIFFVRARKVWFFVRTAQVCVSRNHRLLLSRLTIHRPHLVIYLTFCSRVLKCLHSLVIPCEFFIRGILQSFSIASFLLSQHNVRIHVFKKPLLPLSLSVAPVFSLKDVLDRLLLVCIVLRFVYGDSFLVKSSRSEIATLGLFFCETTDQYVRDIALLLYFGNLSLYFGRFLKF